MIPFLKNTVLQADTPFNVVIGGNIDSKTIIILVHGFGVRSDSRGLFTAIENEFKDSFLTIRADFAEMEDEYIKAIPISFQTKRLQAVIDYAKKEFHFKKLIFVGHSQGCMVIAKAKLTDSKIVLLAPPIESPYDTFVASAGWKYPGSNLDLKGESRLMRSDKTLIIVNPNFWNDFRQIDATDLYLKLDIQNDVYLILAANDYIRGNQTIPNGMNGFFIENANHDFIRDSRLSLLKKLKDIIVL